MNTTKFASSGYTAGQLNAMVKLIKQQAGEDGPERLLRGEIKVSEPARSWREQDGVIYFSVTSDGTTGPEWIKRLEDKDFRISDYVKSLLNSPEFKPTPGVTTETTETTEIAVLKGMLFSDSERITKKIRAYANKQNLTIPNAEIACLIREKFTDEDIETMGLYWIATMHNSIKDFAGDPGLLGVHRLDDGHWLDASWVKPDGRWDRVIGFAFVRSQV